MKVIPKLQKGGGLESFFTTYTPIQSSLLSSSKKATKNDWFNSDKGQLTEKDFFTMLKDIDGLPNEMSSIVSNLIATFKLKNLTGVDTESLATSYLSTLYLIRVASLNKKTYDEALANAIKNGSMAEPAISLDGKLVALDEAGNLTNVDLNTYFENPDGYKVLSVSLLANLRKYEPLLANNLFVFDIINNSIGFEEFQDLLDKAKISLGQSEYIKNGMFSVDGLVSKGLELLKTLKDNDLVLAMGSVTAEGLYKYKIIDKNQLALINALTSYMLSVLPNNVKTWAAFKLLNPNKNEATKNLILLYLLSGSTELHSFDIDYQGSMEEVTKNNKSKGNSGAVSDTIDLNTAMKWLAGFGTYDVFIMNPGTNYATQVLSNTMPLTDSNKKYLGVNSLLLLASLGEYAGILDFNNTSMGMLKIDPTNFGKVVLTDGKISSIDYPSKVMDDGTIIPDLSPKTAEAKMAADREIRLIGIDLSNLDSILKNYQQINNIYIKHGLLVAYNPDGTPANNWTRFGVINASASNNTLRLGPMDDNELLQVIQDDAIVDSLLLITGEDNYDKNEWWNPADWGGNYDHFYRGTVWIPVKTSYIAASANNNMKVNEVMDISLRELALNASNILTREKK